MNLNSNHLLSWVVKAVSTAFITQTIFREPVGCFGWKCESCSCCVSDRPQWQGAGVLPQAGLRAAEPGRVEGLVCPAFPPCPGLQPHLCHLLFTPVGRYVYCVPAQLSECLISVHAYPFFFGNSWLNLSCPSVTLTVLSAKSTVLQNLLLSGNFRVRP